MRLSLAVFVLLVVAFAGCTPRDGSVTRLVEGRRVQGRYVTTLAYAEYSRGSYLEARGQLKAAADAYSRALDDDPDSPELWTRLGAVHCQQDAAHPLKALERALELDPDYEPALRERALCQLSRGKVEAALKDARRALTLDPRPPETTLLFAKVFEKQGKLEQAQRWLEGLVTRAPLNVSGWKALYELAKRRKDSVTQARAAAALASLQPDQRKSLHRQEPSLAPEVSIDAALVDGDLKRARELAIEARLRGATLALRAVELGRPELAKEQAELVLAADPRNSDARIALLAVAGHDAATFRIAASQLWAAPLPPSPRAARLLAELLEQRVGHDARDAWERAYTSFTGQALVKRKSLVQPKSSAPPPLPAKPQRPPPQSPAPPP